MAWDTTLSNAIRTGDAKHVLHLLSLLSEIPEEKQAKNVVKELLLTTNDEILRNAAAITLADMDKAEAGPAILQVLSRPDVIENSGSLLFALEESENNLTLPIALKVLEQGSFEAREECLMLLEEGRFTATQVEREEALQELSRLSGMHPRKTWFGFALSLVKKGGSHVPSSH